MQKFTFCLSEMGSPKSAIFVCQSRLRHRILGKKVRNYVRFSTIKQLKSFKRFLNNNNLITMIFEIKMFFLKNFDLYKTVNSKTNPGRASLTTRSCKCPYFSSTGVMGDRPLHCSIKNPILLTVEDQKNVFHSGCKVIDVTFPNVSTPEV